jgi:hypothetical protein
MYQQDVNDSATSLDDRKIEKVRVLQRDWLMLTMPQDRYQGFLRMT